MKSLILHRCLPSVSFLILFVISPYLSAQTYSDIHDFNNSDGCCQSYPGSLAQGRDGNIYGTTVQGGKNAWGMVFRLTPTGTFTDIYDFNFTDGGLPQGGLSLGIDGNFYGTTYQGGANHFGAIYRVTPSGAETLLYSFTNTNDGAFPRTPPVQALDGNLYGATGNGTVAVLYKLTTSGTFSIAATLPSQSVTPLLLATDGNLYGMTVFGGTLNRGTAFQYSTSKKKLKIIHNFGSGTEGLTPSGPLMQGTDGKLYGVTSTGGTSSNGTVFQMTTAGKLVTLKNFASGSPDGATPFAGLVQGSDGMLYGVCSAGGSGGLGTLYRLTTKGTSYQVLHNFTTPTGDTPDSTPLLHTNGIIYGLTAHGGSHTAYGTIYSFDNGLKPFVSEYLHYSGKVGDSVDLLGQGFSNATGVKFGTGSGTFTASTDAYMTASAAAGATTGAITVVEPGGNLTTPLQYKVIPIISSFTPKSGPVGTQVVITGMSLKQTTTVTIGGATATNLVVNSDTQVTATVAASAKTGKVVLKTKGGSATATGTFTVN